MKLKLSRPIIFFDLETTSLSVPDARIVEISLYKLNVDGTHEIRTRRLNPCIPIPPASTEVHGITDEDVALEPTFTAKAQSLLNYIKDCDLAGFNAIAYDVPVLYHEFLRSGIDWDYSTICIVDPGNVFKIKETRTLSAAVKFYCDREFENAHSAEADVLATVNVLTGQLEKYGDLPTTVEELALYSNRGKKILDISGKFYENAEGEICFSFGEHRGVPAKEQASYLKWMIKKDFAPDTKKLAAKILSENCL
ncbi:3'-5' exonuclease [Larkinella sp. C7]|uniref:3'-5' exonuclease n=1 Tax=Larkinella sp. C7 TaxID=2576607 RepID=UPI00111109CD|nr:3'-5' exonuclease [Larkinella sp. C7]